MIGNTGVNNISFKGFFHIVPDSRYCRETDWQEAEVYDILEKNDALVVLSCTTPSDLDKSDPNFNDRVGFHSEKIVDPSFIRAYIKPDNDLKVFQELKAINAKIVYTDQYESIVEIANKPKEEAEAHLKRMRTFVLH